MDIFEWITTTVVITVAVLVWRHQIRLEKRSEQRFDRLEKRSEQRFDRVDEQFDRTDTRFDRTDTRFDRTDSRFDFLAREVTANGRGIARLEGLHENPHRHIAAAE